MNRRDAAMIAHLDAIEARLTARFDRIDDRLDRMAEDIAGIKVELVTHNHGGDHIDHLSEDIGFIREDEAS
jgi:hypothetical protein